jgi:hypothetical protein
MEDRGVVQTNTERSRVGTTTRAVMLGGALLGSSALVAAGLVRRGIHWGATADEQVMGLPGDAYLADGPEARTVMTRAISIAAPPDVVWPWLAQMGRGAGWYSHDLFDNGGIASARHIVSWIPAPRSGDATAVGWLRDLEPGRSLTWWLPGEPSFGTILRMVVDIRLSPENGGSRLIIRVSGDAEGKLGALIVRLFEVVDSIMAIRQLQGIRLRAEAFGSRPADPATPETGDRDQFQLYEAIWSTGERAGVAGREMAASWRQAAIAAGVVNS